MKTGLCRWWLRCVHLDLEAGRRLDDLDRDGLTHRVDIDGAGLLDGVRPHLDADVRGFHRVVGDALVAVRAGCSS